MGKQNIKPKVNSSDVGRNKYIENGERGRNTKFACYRCGSLSHTAKSDRCPARLVKCLICGIVGHFARVCKKKQVNKKDSKFNKVACV